MLGPSAAEGNTHVPVCLRLCYKHTGTAFSLGVKWAVVEIKPKSHEVLWANVEKHLCTP